MSSIYPRKNSSSLQMATVLPGGKRKVVSLHTSDPQKASRIADKTQALVDTLEGPEKRRQSVLRVLVEDIFIAAQVPNPWVAEPTKKTPWFSEFAKDYIGRKACSATTKDFIRAVCLNFLASKSPQFQEIDQISGLECQAWYDQMSAGLSAGTAKNRLAAVSSVFAQAVKLGVIPSNPCAGIQVKQEDALGRDELTDEEVERLLSKLLEWHNAEPDRASLHSSWRMAVKLGRYAGCRLGDAVKMNADNASIVRENIVLAFTAGKTSDEVIVPVWGTPLGEVLETALCLFPGLPLCPTLHQKSVQHLSDEFGDILERAGIDTGKTVVNGRTRRKKTFHSLRVSFVNDLDRRGVPEDLKMELAGHSTKAMSRHYTHRSAEDIAKRMAPYLNQTSTPA